jgi:hypothetical protein
VDVLWTFSYIWIGNGPPISWSFTISQALNKTSFISVVWSSLRDLGCQGTESELVRYDLQQVRNSTYDKCEGSDTVFDIHEDITGHAWR